MHGVRNKGGTTMKRKEMRERVLREAPTVATLLEDLEAGKAVVADTRKAWDELFHLADDRRVGAKEASAILGVQGPNVYALLKGSVAVSLFGPSTREDGIAVPVLETLGGGKQYRARDIEALGKALGRINNSPHRATKRKRHAQVPVAPATNE